jgi:hypothetical protein
MGPEEVPNTMTDWPTDCWSYPHHHYHNQQQQQQALGQF